MQFRLDLNVIDAGEHLSRFALILHNLSETTFDNWQLDFTVTRFIEQDSISHGEIEQIGSLCHFKTGQPLLANDHVYVEFSHRTKPFTFHDEGINEACIRIQEPHGIKLIPVRTTPVDLARKTPERKALILPQAQTLNLILNPKASSINQGIFYSMMSVRSVRPILTANLQHNG